MKDVVLNPKDLLVPVQNEMLWFLSIVLLSCVAMEILSKMSN
jgi:hypothetical protein